MKRPKWLKWKIGFAGVLGLSVLFHQVKASPEFDKAFAEADNDPLVQAAAPEDSIITEKDAIPPEGQQTDSVQPRFPSRENRTEASSGRSHTKTGRS